MKKLITTVLIAALLLVTLPLSLTSCSQASRLLRMKESDRAAYFYRLVNSKADYAASGSFEQTMSMKLDIGDVAYEQVTEGTITFIAEKDDLTYLEQAKTTVWTGGEKIIIYEDRGYADGMMFLYSKEEKDESKLKSPITAEEYNTFMGELNADSTEIQVGEGYSETMTCVQNEDKTWTATYEGFTDEGMKPFLEMLEGIEYTVTAEHTLKDVRLTYNADKQFYPITVTIEYLFEENKDAETRVPEISVHTEYKGWNNTVLSQPYDISDFTEVSDLRHVERFMKALSDRETAEFGKFNIHVETKATAGDGFDNDVTTDQQVSFKNLNGFTFSLTYDQDGYKYDMNYAKGSMSVVVRDESGKKVHSETTPMTDAEAQMTVSQLVDPEQISGVDIVGMTVRDEEKGIYRFEMGDAVKRTYEEQYELAYGAPLESFKAYCDATVLDGKLLTYTYHVYTVVELDGETFTTTVDMTVTFSDVTEDGEMV